MALAPGTRFGSYEVIAALGAGGMGEVYRARDQKLGRDVALKVLHASVAADPDRLARFRREAQVLASLNHPNIAQIYGFEDSGEVHAIAMEMVEGVTLDATGELSVADVLPLARQIADALEAAHDQGIVHRDLKPGNIKIRPDGTVKVLDFGLAKSVIGTGSTTSASFGTEAATMMSPTMLSPMASPAVTQQGAIMGTAAYMSPEQARGRSIDRRADIWAFGCVLYEMLTSRTLFGGGSIADALSAITRDEPDWGALPPDVGPRVRQLLRRCLNKDARQRLRDIGEARLALDDAIATGDPAEALTSATKADAPSMALSVMLPPGVWLPLDEQPVIALSRDGRTIVCVAMSKEGRQLYRRDISRFGMTPIAGTQGAAGPFFSPDGRSVAFFASGWLRRISIEGGASSAICEVSSLPRGGAWTSEGRIIFAPVADSPLMVVPDTGGTPRPFTELDVAAEERSHRWPDLMPDGRSVIFTIGRLDSAADYDDAEIAVASTTDGARKTVFKGARMARAGGPGELLVQRRGTLLRTMLSRSAAAAPAALETLVEGVAGDAGSGSGFFATSANLLVYAPVACVAERVGTFIVDRTGQATRLPMPAKGYRYPRISPDGRRLAIHIADDRDLDARGTRGDVWIFDLETRRLSRLTTGGFSTFPCWSSDGKRLAYYRSGKGGGVFARSADGGRAETELWATPWGSQRLPESWHPHGISVAVQSIDRGVGMWFVGSNGGSEPAKFGEDMGDKWGGSFSPDGAFLAYTSMESGVPEVFIETLLGDGGRWQVSTDGGMFPLWSADGRELVFAAGDAMMSVALDFNPTIQLGLPTVLFKTPFELRTPPTRNFDMMPDGRFVMIGRTDDAPDRGEICVSTLLADLNA